MKDGEDSSLNFSSRKLQRRQMLRILGLAGSVLALNPASGMKSMLATSHARAPGDIPKRPLGRTGIEVSVLCFGGSHLGRIQDESEAINLLHDAIDAGITFLDNAWEYNGGRSEELMGKALQGRRKQVILMTKLCSHGRDKKVAMQQLEESLRRLKTDYLDLWQIHEVVYDDDPDRHFMPDGGAEALLEAKRQGKVRFIGFTGHKHPKIHLDMLSRNFPFDTCQMPLNTFDGSYRSFEHDVLPVLTERGIAPIGMKSLSGNAEPIKQGVLTPQEAMQYVLSLPIASLVSGIDSHDVLKQNITIARHFSPMSTAQMDGLRKRVAAFAMDGRYELFKSTNRYDGRIGKEQHGLS